VEGGERGERRVKGRGRKERNSLIGFQVALPSCIFLDALLGLEVSVGDRYP
jgi:hypothetical protein